MKVNMPVTDIEVELQPGQVLVSKTNIKGTIVYANKDFIEISGFSEAELLDKNHNLVRHPDMPPEAFKDLWDTVQQGKPWTGLVKNRCKNGDFYWVDANVTPIFQNGQIVEYMSVRHRPRRESIAAAEKLYREIREKREVYGGSWPKRLLKSYQNVSFKVQTFSLIALSLVMLGFSSFEGYTGMNGTADPIIEEQAATSKLANDANALLVDFKIQVQEWKNILLRGNNPENFDKYLASFEEKHRSVQSGLQSLDRDLQRLNISLPEVAALAQTHAELGRQYREALKDYDQNNVLSYTIVDRLVTGLDRKPTKDLDEVVSNITSIANQRFASTASGLQASLDTTLATFLICMSVVLILIMAFASLVFKGILTPISTMMSSFRELGEGNFTAKINIEGDNEVSHLRQALKSMQIKLGFDILEANTHAEEATRIKNALDVCDTNVMLADNNMNIIYTNASLQKMFTTAEDDIRKQLPDFKADKLIGSNADVFHKNPAHQRAIVERLNKIYRSQIEIGSRTFTLLATPVHNAQGVKLGVVVEWKDITIELARSVEEKRIANENARIKQALDNVSANVMVADNDRNIIYINEAVYQTLKNAESDLRKELPSFNADKLLGESIDQFHKNPDHQKGMLAKLEKPHFAAIIVGGRHMSLNVSPVKNEDGERLGTVVEWKDRTAEVAIEKEVDELVVAASRGDLSRRINLDGKTGFFQTLSKGLNTLVNSAESFVTDIGILLSAMSEGNLTQKINSDFEGEFERIKQDANKTVVTLTDIVSKIRESANTVYTASNEIAQGNADLSQRTEEQASSLEETASSMEQMTSTVKQSSDNANTATSLANDARHRAQQGGDVVKQAVSAMHEILKSSHKINDIIGVIDEIAFQTNLLALNAAVEAARAGEQGRGFAVVAGEVRNLSQRSAAAAKEIKDLIKDSVTKVEAGSALVNESGTTLSSIVTAVEKVATIIAEVNNAAAEQTTGIEQINQAVSQMDEMTQQNAALVEEASAASEAMSEQASTMNRLVGFFKVGHFEERFDHTKKAPEPVVTYQQQTPRAATKPSKGASKFSEEDDWEEF
jgi:methyl-accepting chemotaxis protein